MDAPIRILFASSEVTPFARVSEMSDLIRCVPEYLHESGRFESRIMMPRYGIISERRNRLHEVIRLSGSRIPLGEEGETLKVKVASIPGIRLQVYFMDNVKYFKRKGVYQGRDSVVFPDNIVRSLLFARSVLTTAGNLGWSPDVVHAHGWIASLLPVLLKTEYAENPLFQRSQVLYSRDGFTSDERLSAEMVEAFGLGSPDPLVDRPLEEIAADFADVLVSGVESDDDVVALTGTPEEITEQALSLYGQQTGSTVEA
ncbi:MAG: glycogen/starch synthase [Rhodothermales bacterium]